MKLQDLPEKFQAQVRRQLGEPDPAEVQARLDREAAVDAGNEADLQADVERWLEGRGYARRTPKAIQRHHGRRWFVHLAEARGNPIILDLIILDSERGRYLEVELKTSTGALTPDQRALVLRGEGRLCRSLDDVRNVVEAWEVA